ncbi:CAP domain-containing protein [Streptomyces sp. NPDC090025]|uniref:CAP domain-containing protein n=1 Tax=Streptomyces sp. NPDC090025 TaxID=3365922 RepID=UPI003839A91F
MRHHGDDGGHGTERRDRRTGRGRHRREGPRPVRPPGGGRGPSFRAGTALVGTLAAALALLTGVYVTGGPDGPDPGPAAVPVAAVREAPATTAGQYVTQVVNLVNAERRKGGCPALRADGRLRSAAQRHADDMAARDYYAHAGRDGRDAGDRITAAGYDWSSWGENIHRGPRSPAQAVAEWMNSEGHRANILNCSFRDLGVGVNLTANGPWWVQDFATRR